MNKEKNIKIDIIGQGNVGSHLHNVLNDIYDVCLINSRSLQDLRKNSDLYIISVRDDVIVEVTNLILPCLSEKSIIVHTSGTSPLSIIEMKHINTGVFYPLQTFTKGSTLNYNEIPILIEASNDYSADFLNKVALKISRNVKNINSEDRKNLHIASVFSCNFVNHLWALSEKFLKEKGMDFNLLLPLIKETTKKIERLLPTDAQTGPAKRHDYNTLESHYDRLKNDKKLYDIYHLLSKSIMQS